MAGDPGLQSEAGSSDGAVSSPSARVGQSHWLRPFLALVSLIFLGQVAVAPGQSLLAVYVESILTRAPAFTSSLVSTQLVFGAVAALVGGGLADAYGQKRVMILGASGLPLVGVAFLLRSPLALLLLWAYVGFALGLYVLGRQAYAMALVPAQRLGVAFAVIFTGVTMGGAAGNLLAAPILSRFDFSTLGLTAVGMAVLVFAAVNLAIPDAGRVKRDGHGAPFAGYWAMLRQRTTLLLALLQMLPTLYYGAASLLMPLLIYRAAGRPDVSAYYATTSLVFASAGQLLAGRLMDRRGWRAPLVALVAAIAAVALLTALLSQSLWGLFACGVAGITLAWALSVAYPVLVSDLYPIGEHGRTLGLIYVAWSLGMLAGTQTGGRLVSVSPGLPFLVIGLANVVAVALALMLARGSRKGAAGGIPAQCTPIAAKELSHGET